LKKQIFFTVIILSLILAGMALSAVPNETWHGLKIFADGLYVTDANTVVISTSGNITSKELYLTSLDANTVPYLDTNKKFTSSSVTTAELGYLHNVTSAIQTQFTGKANQASGKTATIHNSVDIYGTDGTAITLPSSSCNLAGVTSGKSSTIHNSIEFYGTDSTSVTFPSGGGNVAVYDANSYIADSQVYDKHTNLDANSIGLGIAKDASYALKTAGEIYAEGVINSGSIQPITDDTYYLGKNDDDSGKAYKGLILKDTTNGKYYRIEITNGEIYATDLTD